MNPRKSFLLRIEPGLYRDLESWAQQELRSVNGQIEFLLKQAVARRKREKPTDEAASSKTNNPQTLPSSDVTAPPESGLAGPADDG